MHFPLLVRGSVGIQPLCSPSWYDHRGASTIPEVELPIGIFADYVDINPKAKTTLLFLHGWPSLWASWKYQIQEFQVVIDSHIVL